MNRGTWTFGAVVIAGAALFAQAGCSSDTTSTSGPPRGPSSAASSGAGGSGGSEAASSTAESTASSSTASSSASSTAAASSSSGGGMCPAAGGDNACTGCVKNNCCDLYLACMADPAIVPAKGCNQMAPNSPCVGAGKPVCKCYFDIISAQGANIGSFGAAQAQCGQPSDVTGPVGPCVQSKCGAPNGPC